MKLTEIQRRDIAFLTAEREKLRAEVSELRRHLIEAERRLRESERDRRILAKIIKDNG